MEKNIYLLQFEMYDGEDCNEWSEVYENYADAKSEFDELVESYDGYWICFDTIERDNNSIRAYDNGCYDDGHFEISITKKEIK